MRATEVTINNKDNSYNQHMHVLVCVEPTYFKNTENYVNQKQWIQFWKKAMKLDYDPNLTYSPCLNAGDSWIQTILAY